MDDSTDHAIQSLHAAIVDAQGAIRAFDVKAEIMAAFFMVLLGVLQWIAGDVGRPLVQAPAIMAALAGAAGIWCLGVVLLPRSKKRFELNLGGYSPVNVFYPPVTNEPAVNVAKFSERARGADWIGELTFEQFKLVRIRAEKERWFRRAILWGGMAFALAVLTLILSFFAGTPQ